jgi:class 3 adenylate cyclase
VQQTVLAAPTSGSVVLATILAIDPETMAQPERRAVVADIAQRGGGRVFAQSGVVVFDRPSQAITCGARLACVMADAPGVAVHSGECEITATAVRGVAVDLVIRMAASARSGELLVTRTIRDLVAGSDLAYERRESVTVDDSSHEWQTFAVTAPPASA